MSLPVEKIRITRDDAFDAFLKEQGVQLAKKPAKLARDVLKKQANDSIERLHSLNDQTKEISKQAAATSIDTSVNLTTKAVVSSAINYLKKSSS
jgi:hypothetical protein